ncbi:unnamed protein product [Parajaminaea phylloscopi]
MTIAAVPPVVALAAQIDIDVDSVDVDLTRQLSALGVQPNDMTSNQFVIGDALTLPETQPLLQQVVSESKGDSWLTILDRISVRLCALNLPNISGRALLQASPAYAYDTEATIKHARSYAAEFAAAGVGRDRFAIKIMTTGPGMLAAQALEQEGIRTLGTGIFGVPQALAAAQAGCLYISPYFNEILAHFAQPGTLPVYPNALDHPMSPRMAQIYQAYRQRGGKAPLVKSASFVAVSEVLAMPLVGAQQATILAPTLRLMCDPSNAIPQVPDAYRPSRDYTADLPPAAQALLSVDPLRPDGAAQKVDVTADWLANGADLLTAAIAEDNETNRRLRDAIATFQGAEKKAQALVEAAMTSQS